jgi:hypothetical protein
VRAKTEVSEMLLLIKRYVKLMAFVALLSCLWACSSKELSREKAEAILRKNFKNVLIEDCSLKGLNSLLLLSNKPEFVALNEGQFCEKKPVVTSIHKTSEREAVIEFKAVSKANPLVLKKWLEAMEKFEARLTNLHRKVYDSWPLDQWEFRDPTDGQIFARGAVVVRGDLPNKIKDTEEWKRLQDAKQYCLNLLEKGQLESELSTRQFRLYDDGWRMVN